MITPGEGQVYGCQLVTIRKFCQRFTDVNLLLYVSSARDYYEQSISVAIMSIMAGI